MIQGVIFDFDGTLYDYDLCNRFALNKLFENISQDNNIEISQISNLYNQINTNIKISNSSSNKFNKIIYIKRLVEELKIPLSKLQKYLNIYEESFASKFELFQGVRELFVYLKESNIKIGILTNNKFDQQHNKLIESNLIQLIDWVQSSDECGYEKPDINMFLNIQNKMKIPFENLCMIGDNFEHDISPAIKLGMICFYYKFGNPNRIIDNIFYFSDYIWLNDFFTSYFISVNELIFLSKYFGQSELNVQGPGGNISVKMGELMLIKSSGCVMGNITPYTDYCVINTFKCQELVSEQRDRILETKVFGYKTPSMESYFHSFMKKYTVHIHFTLSNIFACSENFESVMGNFKYPYCIIKYQIPGILLSYDIKENYSPNCDIYFLLNHGLIITSNSIEEIFDLYEYIFNYFNLELGNKYSFDSFVLNKSYSNVNKYKIIKETNYDVNLFKNIILCFPDLAVFIQNMIFVENIEEINLTENNDIIIYRNKVYVIADNITKVYSIIEIINSYVELANSSNKLISITNVNYLINMEQEKLRK